MFFQETLHTALYAIQSTSMTGHASIAFALPVLFTVYELVLIVYDVQFRLPKLLLQTADEISISIANVLPLP